jgi:hypothetical protein
MATGIGVTKGLLDWKFQSSYVERVMDNAAYQAAHPDDTLVLAGPARKGSVNASGAPSAGAANTLLAIGMLQSVSFTQSKPTQPMMAIGSGRSFFVSGKAQTQWSIGRLFVNGRNLLRVLMHNAVAAGLPVERFDDPAANSATSNFFTNLDSELYYIPFGLASLFRNKAHDLVGSFYAELCMINSYAIGMNAGQNMMLENVSGLADRLLPFNNAVDTAGAAWGTSRATVDAILDFTSTDPVGADTNPGVLNEGVTA